MTPEQELLVTENMKLIPAVTRNFMGRYGIATSLRDELMDEGQLALVKAASEYRDIGKMPFKTYAAHKIKYAIADYCAKFNNFKPLRMPKMATEGSKYYKFQRRQQRKARMRQKIADGYYHSIDIPAFRRSMLAECGLLF